MRFDTTNTLNISSFLKNYQNPFFNMKENNNIIEDEKNKEQPINKEKGLFDKNMIDNMIKKELFKQKQEFEKKQKDNEIKIKKLEDIIANQNKPILVGLNNIGATCYMNATLQCLSNTKKLTEFFLYTFKNIAPDKIMSNEYYKVLLNLYSPYSFKETLSKENPLFAGIQANDSKDLINFLIERFHQELNINDNKKNINIIANPDQTNEQMMLNSFLQEFKENFNSPISAYFYGILETKSKCQGCNIIKFNFQIYSF